MHVINTAMGLLAGFEGTDPMKPVFVKPTPGKSVMLEVFHSKEEALDCKHVLDELRIKASIRKIHLD